MKAASPAPGGTELPRCRYAGARLLLVDDEPLQLKTQQRLLESSGFTVTAVATPQEALRCLERGQYDILLADLAMPSMDGVSLIRLAKACVPELTGLIVTAAATVDSAIDAMKAGASDYLLKPFDLLQVLPVIEHALAARDLQRAQRLAAQMQEDHLVLVTGLHHQLELARARIEQISDAKSVFLASLNHALRGPLNSILGFSAVLSAPPAALSDAERSHFLANIHDAAKQMLNLLNEARDLTQLEQAEVVRTIAPVELSALVRECAHLVEPGLQFKRLQLDLGGLAGGWALADRLGLRQSLLSLLNDAIWQSPAGQTVQVRSVMTDAQVQLIFSRRGAEPTASPGLPPALDLGLPFAQELLRAMDGLLVQRQLDDGSVIAAVTLLAAAPPPG